MMSHFLVVFAILALAPYVSTDSQTSFGAVQLAERFSGLDCGAKIMKADAALGSSPGEIWVNQNCGKAWTTAVALSPFHTLRFVQGGTYTLTKPIIVGQRASIVCGTPAPAGGSNCTLRARGGIATNFLTLGTHATIRDMTIDGGAVDQSTGGNTPAPGTSGTTLCLVNASSPSSAGRITIDHTMITGSSGHGLCISNQIVPRIESAIIMFNHADGIKCSSSGDMFISDSEIEQNGLNGIELENCPATRINHSDFGLNGSTAGGRCASSTLPPGYYGQLYIHGKIDAWNTAGYQIISSNQFGNGCGPHIYIAGGSQNPTTCNTITGNQFMGMRNSPGLKTAQPEIYIVNGYKNSISGNFFGNGMGGVSFGIEFHAAAKGVSAPSAITGNTFDNGFTSYTDGNEDAANVYVGNVAGSK